MPIDRSELSSLTGLLEQLTVRLGAMAESAQRDKDDLVAKELFAAERSLSSAERRLGRLVRAR